MSDASLFWASLIGWRAKWLVCQAPQLGVRFNIEACRGDATGHAAIEMSGSAVNRALARRTSLPTAVSDLPPVPGFAAGEPAPFADDPGSPEPFLTITPFGVDATLVEHTDYTVNFGTIGIDINASAAAGSPGRLPERPAPGEVRINAPLVVAVDGQSKAIDVGALAAETPVDERIMSSAAVGVLAASGQYPACLWARAPPGDSDDNVNQNPPNRRPSCAGLVEAPRRWP